MATLGPLRHAQSVTPSDTLPLRWPSLYLSFTNSGTQTLTIDTPGGETGVEITLPSGMWPICAIKIHATGTTVTNIVQYWES